MTKHLLVLCALLTGSAGVSGQSTNPFVLWPDGAPGALGRESQDVPTLTMYFPSPAGAGHAVSRVGAEAMPALVICPGGGYARLAEHEGRDYALWLNEQGIAGFVLKYRLGTNGYRHPAMLQDAARAVRVVRSRAGEWHVDPRRIGIIGSSAGGHLASTLLTHFDAGNPDAADPVERASSRPDVGVLCYPVITMGRLTHQGSRRNLLGPNPAPELVAALSNELHVTRDTPPCFIWHTADDATVPVENSLEFAAALRRAGVPFELHIYEHGRHGQGLGSRDDGPAKRLPWTRACADWLQAHGFAK